jgi:hypothetical protein
MVERPEQAFIIPCVTAKEQWKMMIDIDEVVEIVGKAFRQASNSTIGYKSDQALEVAAKKIMTELQIHYLIHRLAQKESIEQ